MNRKALSGFILILIGIVLTLNTMNLLNLSIWSLYFKHWPLLLIIIGISMLLPKNIWAQSIFWLIVILLPIIWSFTGFSTSLVNPSTSIPQEKTIKEEMQPSITNAELNLDIDHASVSIESGDHLLYGHFNTKSSSLNYHKSIKKNNAQFNIDINNSKKVHDSNSLNLQLNPHVIWNVKFDSGASLCNWDLTKLRVDNLDIDSGASDINIKMSDKSPSAKIRIDSGAADIKLNIPASVGVKMQISSPLITKNLSGKWVKDGSYIVSENYSSSTSKLYIDVNSGVSQFSIIHE